MTKHRIYNQAGNYQIYCQKRDPQHVPLVVNEKPKHCPECGEKLGEGDFK